MQDTNFIPRQTLVTAAWLQAVNDFLNGGVASGNERNIWLLSLHSFLSETEIADTVSGVAPTINLTTKINTAMGNIWALLKPGIDKGSHGIRIIVPSGSYLLDYLDCYPGITLDGANQMETQFLQSDTSTALRFFNVLARAGNTTKSRIPNFIATNITLVGNNTTATDGFATENPSNDPDYTVDKIYNSFTTDKVTVKNFNGDGIKVANRGRGNWSHTRTQGCSGHGYNIQGPDCLVFHPASGGNGKHSIYCSQASSPRIVDGEIWASTNAASSYYGIYMDRCREFAIVGGDINAPIKVVGAQDNPADSMYGYWGKGIITGVDFKFRGSTFDDSGDGTPAPCAGYILVQAWRGLTITSCTFTPAYSKATNTYTYRPDKIVDFTGECSIFFDCALPPLKKADGVTDYGLWPCGTGANSRGDIFSSNGKAGYRYSVPDKEGDQPKFYQSQIVQMGEATGATPGTGEIGESIEGNVNVGAAVALTTNTTANITSITLTPGRWEIRATVHCGGTGATGTQIAAGVATTAATLPGTPKLFGRCSIPFTTITNSEIMSIVIPPYTVQVTANTTYYLNAKCTFTAGTMAAYGHMEAIRIA